MNGFENIETPPIELIQFVEEDVNKVKSDLFTTSISEVCFYILIVTTRIMHHDSNTHN